MVWITAVKMEGTNINKKPENRCFDINKHFGKICCDSEQYKVSDSFCYFDKKSYQIIGFFKPLTAKQKSAIKDTKRYIPLPQWISDSRYKELIKELNSEKVTDFFLKAENEEDAYFRYRCFIDWNGLEQSEWYKCYLVARNILENWCIENNITYTNELNEPPANYFYNRESLSDDWILEGH